MLCPATDGRAYREHCGPQVCTGRVPGRDARPHFPSQQRPPESASWRDAGVTKETIFSRQQLGVRGQSEEYKVHTIPTLCLERGGHWLLLYAQSVPKPSDGSRHLSFFPSLLGAHCKAHDSSSHLLPILLHWAQAAALPYLGSTWLSAQLVLLRNEELRMALNTSLTLLH